MDLTMTNLEDCFKGAIDANAKYVGVKIEMQNFDKPEIIINENQNFQTKLDYYKKAYDENLILKSFNGIKIIGFTFANTFEEIRQNLKIN